MCKGLVCVRLEHNPVPARGPGWCRWQCASHAQMRWPGAALQDPLPLAALLLAGEGGTASSGRGAFYFGCWVKV